MSSAETASSCFASALERCPVRGSRSTPSDVYVKILPAGEIAEFLVCVCGLAYDEKPKYAVLKKILLGGLESSGIHYDGPLAFCAAAGTQNHRTAAEASKVSLTGLGLFLTSAFSFVAEEIV